MLLHSNVTTILLLLLIRKQSWAYSVIRVRPSENIGERERVDVIRPHLRVVQWQRVEILHGLNATYMYIGLLINYLILQSSALCDFIYIRIYIFAGGFKVCVCDVFQGIYWSRMILHKNFCLARHRRMGV